MKHPAGMLINIFAALLLLTGGAANQELNGRTLNLAPRAYESSARNLAPPKQDRDLEKNTNHLADNKHSAICNSEGIRDYLLRRGVIPPSQELQGSLLAGATPEVRVIYLVPSDKQPRSGVPSALTDGIRHLQRWYLEQMRNGNTFKLHYPVVEVVRSNHDERWFSTNPEGDNPSLYLWFNSIKEASARFFDPDYVYVIYADVESSGQAIGGTSGVALLAEHDVIGMIGEHPTEREVCRWVGGLGHELGHALGLPHPPECDSHQSPNNSPPCQSLMYLGYISYPDTYLLPDNKDKLNRSPFIVPLQLDSPPFDCSTLLPFAISLSTPSQGITAGASISYVVNVFGAAGYTQPVELTASVSPPDGTLTASFSPNNVMPDGSATLTIETSLSTPPGEYTITVTGSGGGTERTAVSWLIMLTKPSISSLEFDGKKKLTVSGEGFGSAPRILINNADRTDYITSMSGTTVRVKGKSKKLGLKPGGNTIQIIGAGGEATNVFILQI